MTVNLAGEYRLESQSEYYPCQLSDLGAGGLSLLSKGTVYSGDQLRIRFRMDQRTVEIRGVVVRVNGKAVGVQYVDVSEEEIASIQDYIHQTFFEKDKKNLEPRLGDRILPIFEPGRRSDSLHLVIVGR